jgi:hypothetical protein
LDFLPFFYGGMRQFKGKIIEIMSQLGNQLAALYPEKFNYDMLGRSIEQTYIFIWLEVFKERVLNIKK